MRPGLGSLSSRAGEALGSYVTPTTAPAASGGESTRDAGAVMRAPTAAPELVRTGRPSARHGGGEVEIPAWFESAARKMFAERSSSGSVAEDISLAELTLVQSAPAANIAASSRDVAGTQPGPVPQAPNVAHEEHHIDIEKVANEVHKHLQVLMDSARARNGEPFQ
jgi:hypothetical protein